MSNAFTDALEKAEHIVEEVLPVAEEVAPVAALVPGLAPEVTTAEAVLPVVKEGVDLVEQAIGEDQSTAPASTEPTPEDADVTIKLTHLLNLAKYVVKIGEELPSGVLPQSLKYALDIADHVLNNK